MKLQHELPTALVVAGYDPSGGAGVIADLRAMEQRGVLGQAAITGNTFQTDLRFEGVEWCEEGALRQVKLLSDRNDFRAVKIGLIPSFGFLERLLDLLDQSLPAVPIVWDPILSATAGFDFHSEEGLAAESRLRVIALMKRLALTTPNLEEYHSFFENIEEKIEGEKPPLLVKSALQREGEIGDLLFAGRGEVVSLWKRRIPGAAKHGSGCLLSSLIAAGLARGEELEESCRNAEPLVERYLTSSTTLLGHWFQEKKR